MSYVFLVASHPHTACSSLTVSAEFFISFSRSHSQPEEESLRIQLEVKKNIFNWSLKNLTSDVFSPFAVSAAQQFILAVFVISFVAALRGTCSNAHTIEKLKKIIYKSPPEGFEP